ncbi:hypothetical protein RclHR1_10300003 [Rhizophagus clarus]|uniref:Uncharacterized protein n=1 Tax=Rhizophagus clarus TaxID=94130 RepID=A0A2Z6QFF8_9GLOM|nr:hypothetical protein RclHR1_10300003 [Rhizophagus clarus]
MDNNSKDQGISTAKQTEKMSADNTESSGTEKTSDDSEESLTLEIQKAKSTPIITDNESSQILKSHWYYYNVAGNRPVKDVGGWYSTYRYKFHVSVVKLANEFTILHKDEADYDKLLEEFMTEDVWKQLLQMHLKATNRLKLKKNGIITAKLSLFVCQIV